MQNEHLFDGNREFFKQSWGSKVPIELSRQGAIGVILVVALLAFELFNFDTTRFALSDLLGGTNFVGIPWAAILAVAFCAIDFAGLAHLFAPEREQLVSRESWYLMGAWLLGATMNALMTWWAVNLTLIHNQFGNEVLSREQLLAVVPPFVAVLVWLTRILFIGAFSMAGDHFFQRDQPAALQARPAQSPAIPQPAVRQAFVNGPRQEQAARQSRQRPPIPSGRHPIPRASMSPSRSDRREV